MERDGEWSGYEADCAGDLTEHGLPLRPRRNESGRFHDRTGRAPCQQWGLSNRNGVSGLISVRLGWPVIG